MVIYGLKNCDSCRKAMKAFPQAELRDVRVDGVPEEVLVQAFGQFGAALLNTRSTTWRGLDETERADDPIALIKAYPTLMKRPLTAVDSQLFLGWNNGVESELKALS